MRRPRVAIGDGITRKVQTVTRVVAVERLVARLEKIKRLVRRDPAVLRAVGRHPHDRRLRDPFGRAVLDVCHGPRARATLGGARSRSKRRAAASRAESYEKNRYGKTRILAAPVAVETCSAGGFTIVSSSRLRTLSSSNPEPARIVFDS